MTIYGNLPPLAPDYSTNSFFENFFKQSPTVSENTNDAIIGYFQSVTGDKDSGTTLAAAVLYTAGQQGIQPMELIDQFRKLSPGELNAYLTMFLNINRVSTSLLGLSNQPQTSKYVTRAVLP
jgi:hypothetical protein